MSKRRTSADACLFQFKEGKHVANEIVVGRHSSVQSMKPIVHSYVSGETAETLALSWNKIV